jgi:hypothetical protein
VKQADNVPDWVYKCKHPDQISDGNAATLNVLRDLGHDEPLRPDLERLVARLVAEGGGIQAQLGRFVNAEIDEEFCRLLQTFGAFFPGKSSKLKRGRPRDCHDNVRHLVFGTAEISCGEAARQQQDKSTVGFTGLALSPDGVWRVHSWAQSPSGIIETTVKRTMYFGVCRRLRSRSRQRLSNHLIMPWTTSWSWRNRGGVARRHKAIGAIF